MFNNCKDNIKLNNNNEIVIFFKIDNKKIKRKHNILYLDKK